jgi:flagellar protein FliO/FliZ
MKWVFSFLLILGLQVQAQNAAGTAVGAEIPDGAAVTMEPVNPPTEIQVAIPAPEPKKNLAEAEIPVNLETPQKSVSTGNPFIKMLMSVMILGVLAAAGFYWLRKYRYTNLKSQATQIKILSQHYLGPKKSLAIVRVAGESILIGVTDHNISMIKSLSLLDEDIPEETPKEFGSIFTIKSRNDSPTDEIDNRDDFSLAGIKDFVSGRLKNMRNLE